MCALLIRIPHEKAQVTESLLKTGLRKKDLFRFFFSFKLFWGVSGGQETNMVFSMLSAKKGFCDASE